MSRPPAENRRHGRFIADFACPHCQSRENSVVNSGNAYLAGGFTRKRQCGGCGKRFDTAEIPLARAREHETERQLVGYVLPSAIDDLKHGYERRVFPHPVFAGMIPVYMDRPPLKRNDPPPP